MDEISERIKHIKTVLSSDELRTFCFDLGIDYDLLTDDDSTIFASNLLSYLQEENQLETLMDVDYFFDTSMAKGLSPDAIQLIALHTKMITSKSRNAVVYFCNEILLKRWEEYEQLEDRDFYREVILLAKRKGHLPILEETFLTADSLDSIDWLLAINTGQPNLSPEQKDDLVSWMKTQANINDLAQLAFLMGEYDIEISSKYIDYWIKRFVEYFERRNRLGQVSAIKSYCWD